MIFSVSGGSMYLIEGTSNQNHQSNIGSLHGSSDPNMFFTNSIIRPLRTSTSPKISATTIWSGPRWHYPETTTVYPSFAVNQCPQQQFWPAITGHQIIVGNTTTDTPLLAGNECDLSKLLLLLCNLNLKYDTTISLKIIMIKLLRPHSLHQEINSYSTGLLPYLYLKIPSLPSGPFCGRTIPWKIQSNLHHYVLSTCKGHYQFYLMSCLDSPLQIPPTRNHGGLWK